jgi:kinetochore protein NDC80
LQILSVTWCRKSSLVPRQSSLSTARGPDPRFGENKDNMKQFLSNSIRDLIGYLSDHNYDHQINPKILSKPTNKDFYNIVGFLFKQLDPNYVPTGKIEDEIVNMFKYLGYPYPISKTNIVAVGSPHAWPSMLAAVMWLIELLTYSENMSQVDNQLFPTDINGDVTLGNGMSPHDVGDEITNSEKAFHKYITKAYGYFITGNDAQHMSLHEQFVSSFENRNLIIRDKLESLDKKNLAINNEIEDLKQKTSLLPSVDQNRKELQKELYQLTTLLDEKKKVNVKLTSQLEDRQEELNKTRELIHSMNTEINRLQDIISRQEISPEDIQNMINEKIRLENELKLISEHRSNLTRKIWELEISLRDKVQLLEDTVRTYHSIAEDLKMIPQSARNSRNENLMIEIDIRAKRREGLLKTMVKQAILPILLDVKRELQEMTLELRDEFMKEQEAKEELESSQNELRTIMENFDSKLKRIEAIYKREKENLDSFNDVHLKEIDSMETRLLQLTDTAVEEAKITSSTRRITEINSLRQTKYQEYVRTKKHLIESIMEVVSLSANHREMVLNSLEQLKSNYQAKLNEIVEYQNTNFQSYVEV